MGSSFGNFGTPGRLRRQPVLGPARPGPRPIAATSAVAEAQRHTADIDVVRVQAQVANDVVAAYKARVAAAEAMDDARQSVTEASSRWTSTSPTSAAEPDCPGRPGPSRSFNRSRPLPRRGPIISMPCLRTTAPNSASIVP